MCRAETDLPKAPVADVLVRRVQQRGISKMKPTQQLHDLGQSLWLDKITRDLLTSGTLERYMKELSVAGLTSNPTIFDQAIKNSTAYNAAIQEKLEAESVEAVSFELALEDSRRAADLFRQFTIAQMVSMAEFLWRSRRCWRTTQVAHWQQAKIYSLALSDQTSLSKPRAQKKGSRRLRNRFSPAFQ